jgi:hypothetical protein
MQLDTGPEGLDSRFGRIRTAVDPLGQDQALRAFVEEVIPRPVDQDDQAISGADQLVDMDDYIRSAIGFAGSAIAILPARERGVPQTSSP